MDNFRLVFRLSLFLVSVLVFYIFLICQFLFVSDKNRTLWRIACVKNWSKAVAKIIGMKIQVEGKPPNPPFFLVSNHLSYMDIFLIFTQCNCVFIAKQEISSWLIIGHLCKLTNTLFLDRTNKKDIPRVNKLVSENINEFQGIVLFPEGTSTKGEKVLPFKPSLLDFPAKNEVPVSFASISYRSNEIPASLSVCWWQDESFQTHFLRLLKTKNFEAKLTFGEDVVQENDRKILAQKLWEKVNQNFTPAN
ncbi:1-acyl-sn-glycerol-3-phosphate acyltransferase [bacterium]|nr:1-acyl-sn-glycerol-3-phosphate acyltransferase [bacterium]